ncbi:helix-turn-helix domain-containing protein [Streptantibioticus silvisoli]|uniref:Helix-turn-helix transcriptional regulator n=1 Tax=Streptantibioticus silvisoli TaxID=2705255 RepID=A0ABT6W244_9ACTN|nr:helix-turn-helix transcriptional regulator [Streptantibioticus silvisoli]MDI5964815.1 helix-turn-helix transcriptional regulator [Streptantibioticus silvisoli]
MADLIRERSLPPLGYGAVLNAARHRAGWSLREASRRLGLSYSYVRALEAGERCPSVTVARTLADVLGLDDNERDRLLASAVDNAGRDHPDGRSKGPGRVIS